MQREDSEISKHRPSLQKMHVTCRHTETHKQDIPSAHSQAQSHPCFYVATIKLPILCGKTNNLEITKMSWKRTKLEGHRHTDIYTFK